MQPLEMRMARLNITMLITIKHLFIVSDSHKLIVSDDLDCHLLASPGSVPGSDYIAEHSLTRVAIDIIAFV